MDRHLLAFAQVVLVTYELVTHLLDREATPEEGACFSVLGEDQIMVLESSCCADT